MHAFDRWTVGRTDGRRTDRILIARPRLHSMQRVKNLFRTKTLSILKLPSSRLHVGLHAFNLLADYHAYRLLIDVLV